MTCKTFRQMEFNFSKALKMQSKTPVFSAYIDFISDTDFMIQNVQDLSNVLCPNCGYEIIENYCDNCSEFFKGG